MELSAKINARLQGICKGFATVAFVLGVAATAGEWLWRQLSGQNVQHAWLEPAGGLFAIAAMFAVATVAGRPPQNLRAGVSRLLGLFAVCAALVGGFFVLDWDSARSAFHGLYSLRLPMSLFALAATLGLLRALRLRPAQRQAAPARSGNDGP